MELYKGNIVGLLGDRCMARDDVQQLYIHVGRAAGTLRNIDIER